MYCYPHIVGIVTILFFQTASCSILEKFFNGASSCELRCKGLAAPELKKSCAEGCRLYTVIGLAKGFPDTNKTLNLCLSACSEAFNNDSTVNACSFGCRLDYQAKPKDDTQETQTLHLLTPLIYVKSAYNTMAHHMKQFISTTWTVYVQEDTGKMVILQTNPKVVESSDYTFQKNNGNSLKPYQQGWQEEKLDWVDCIAHQSGIPRWLLVIVLFAFILALLWLCCATAVTAPNHYVSSTKKKNVGYVLVCEPDYGMKPAPPLINCDEEAPPLPPKVTII